MFCTATFIPSRTIAPKKEFIESTYQKYQLKEHEKYM